MSVPSRGVVVVSRGCAAGTCSRRPQYTGGWVVGTTGASLNGACGHLGVKYRNHKGEACLSCGVLRMDWLLQQHSKIFLLDVHKGCMRIGSTSTLGCILGASTDHVLIYSPEETSNHSLVG